ncbi:calmodulin-like protein 5 [Mercenaria mercenaria]|uniref:calmodulin-like protein 5 n=1 Tax=Mercenaria mercenaria TaxID=6596 RepID=UPI00234E3C8D|nr:calmodulin-like protein 5 [Mercenaria mercenaria]
MSLTPEQCEQFWNCTDVDCSGELTIQELKAGIHKYNPNISDQDCAKMFCDIDKSGDKRITKEEFLKEMQEKPKRSETLCQLFNDYDTSGDGKLAQDELAKLLATFFKERDPQEVMKEFLKYVDTSGDNMVSYEEFRNYFG